jgi:hypothetical protein
MSSLMDLAGALGGAPPPGGPPPGLGAGPPPPGLGPPPDAGLPPDAGAPPPDQGGGGYENSLDALDGAEEALHAFIQLDPDEEDRAAAGKALQVVLQLKATNQKSNQAGDLKSLARNLQTGGALA